MSVCKLTPRKNVQLVNRPSENTTSVTDDGYVPTSNDPTHVVSFKPRQSAQTAVWLVLIPACVISAFKTLGG